MGPAPGIEALVEAVYAALRTGDAAALEALLDPAFAAHFADGMPAGGGDAEGPRAAREHWWAIGARFAVAAEPQELAPLADGRLLVRGRYRGRARGDGREIDARFMHLWEARGDRLVALEQLTDTALWTG